MKCDDSRSLKTRSRNYRAEIKNLKNLDSLRVKFSDGENHVHDRGHVGHKRSRNLKF